MGSEARALMSPVESIKQARAEPVPTSIPMKWSFFMSIGVISMAAKEVYSQKRTSVSVNQEGVKLKLEVSVCVCASLRAGV